MRTKNTGKKITSAVLFVAVIIAVYWLTQENIKNFEKKVAAQTRRHLLNTDKSEIHIVKAYRWNIPKIFAQDLRIQKAVIYNTFIILLAAIVLGYLFYRAIWPPFEKPKGTTDASGKDKLSTKKFNELLEEKLQQRTAELALAQAELQKQSAKQPLVTKSLQRRIKQLNCFYGLSRIVEQSKVSLEQILRGAANLICNAYQYPKQTCIRITFDGVHYETDRFEKSEISQYAQIKVRGDNVGDIKVYYLGEKTQASEGPFLKEERDLLDAVAERLGRIIELKQAQEKLQLSRNLINRSNDCIFVIEPKWGRLLDVNDRACDSLGYTREELLDMTFNDIKEIGADDSSWQNYVKELELRGDVIREGRHKRKNETEFFVETSLKLVSQGKRDYIIAITRDITERKQAEENQAKLIQELKSTNQIVEGINQELKDFAYIVSHDLKAPLRGIKTLADWISSDYSDKLDENGKEQMNLLLARVGRMHNLIDGVLQYSRVGRSKEEMVQVDLNELITDVIDMVAPPANIAIAVENKLPVIECEKTRIMQVFENLLSNAIKYMDKPRGRVRIGCVEQDGFWRFSVADNGPGIEEKHFERIFRIFQTLSPRDEFESTGIGLTVIKKIVESYGGKIWVQSKVGQGSTFFFTLPKQKEITYAKLKANIAC